MDWGHLVVPESSNQTAGASEAHGDGVKTSAQNEVGKH